MSRLRKAPSLIVCIGFFCSGLILLGWVASLRWAIHYTAPTWSAGLSQGFIYHRKESYSGDSADIKNVFERIMAEPRRYPYGWRVERFPNWLSVRKLLSLPVFEQETRVGSRKNSKVLVQCAVQRLRMPMWLLFAFCTLATLVLFLRCRSTISPGHCRKCGYNLTGNVSGVCSECGTRIAQSS